MKYQLVRLLQKIDEINDQIEEISKGEIDDFDHNVMMNKLKQQKAINRRIFDGLMELQQSRFEKENEEKKIVEESNVTQGLGNGRDVRKHRSGKIYITSKNTNKNNKKSIICK